MPYTKPVLKGNAHPLLRSVVLSGAISSLNGGANTSFRRAALEDAGVYLDSLESGYKYICQRGEFESSDFANFCEAREVFGEGVYDPAFLDKVRKHRKTINDVLSSMDEPPGADASEAADFLGAIRRYFLIRSETQTRREAENDD
jgi:hypothetical protein